MIYLYYRSNLKIYVTMKTKKLRLAELSKKNLSKKQMKVLKGGDWCYDKCGTQTPPVDVAIVEWLEYFYAEWT